MNKVVFIAAVVLSQLSASAFAQTTRAEVKSEAASANKARAIPSGEMTKEPKAKSTKAKAEVKAETKDAIKKGDMPAAGEVGKK